MGANVVDTGGPNSYGQDIVYLEFAECLERLESSKYCFVWGGESDVTLGGAKLEMMSRIAGETYVRLNFNPIEAHRQTLNTSIRLKFGRHDYADVKRSGDSVWTEYRWVQDLSNHMTMPESASNVSLLLDLTTDADIDDF